jgi:hypothetical protein
MMSDDLWDTLAQVAKTYYYLLPHFAILLIGAALCIARWRRHPQVSLLALCAFMLLALEFVVGMTAHFWMLRLLPDLTQADMQEQVEFRLSILRMITTAIHGLAWLLLLIALFGWRNAPTPTYYAPHEGEARSAN